MACGFESRHRHHVGAKSALLRRSFIPVEQKNVIRPLPCSSSPTAIRSAGFAVGIWSEAKRKYSACSHLTSGKGHAARRGPFLIFQPADLDPRVPSTASCLYFFLNTILIKFKYFPPPASMALRSPIAYAFSCLSQSAHTSSLDSIWLTSMISASPLRLTMSRQ